MEGNFKKLFAALQANLRSIGYTLDQPFSRVANLLNTRTNKFQKNLKEEKNGKRREKKKAESWIKIALHPEEISRTPYDIVAEMSEKENELRRENNDLQDAQAEQAEQLYEALKEVHAEKHRGRNASDVCHKQQQRHRSFGP